MTIIRQKANIAMVQIETPNNKDTDQCAKGICQVINVQNVEGEIVTWAKTKDDSSFQSWHGRDEHTTRKSEKSYRTTYHACIYTLISTTYSVAMSKHHVDKVKGLEQIKVAWPLLDLLGFNLNNPTKYRSIGRSHDRPRHM